MNDLILKIEQWANERNLIDGCTPLDQSMKLFSEFGELADAVGKNDLEGIKDGIGDVFVVLTIMCRQNNYSIGEATHTDKYISSIIDVKRTIVYILTDIVDWVDWFEHLDVNLVLSGLEKVAKHYDLTLQECVEHSYNEIKDRKGVMYNGQFVKSTDSQYESILEKLKSNPPV